MNRLKPYLRPALAGGLLAAAALFAPHCLVDAVVRRTL